MKSKWVFLSYELSNELSGYGNGPRIAISLTNDQNKGDTSNNSLISLPSHFGTHIDFPFHFDSEGKSGSEYKADQFVFNSVEYIDLSMIVPENYLYEVKHFESFDMPENEACDLLLINTGFHKYRYEDRYWKEGNGFGLGTAALLKKKYPNLRAIAFDLISLNSYQQRSIGRAAHKEFLVIHDILIIEDVDLKTITGKPKFETIIVSPLKFNRADGTPVTILAKIINND
jgi:arylformamidase